jgi:hypothetical protein
MHRTAAVRIVLILTVFCAALVFAAPQSRPKEQPAAKQTAMSGCIDEQDGRYVLIHDQTRALIANLEAEGFPTEGFAKHLGHKVTIRGTVASDEPHPVVKVRSIETISDHCGSPQH